MVLYNVKQVEYIVVYTRLSGLVYQYKCGGCNATYYVKTKRHFKAWICEHLGISHLTGKKVKTDNKKLTTIQEYLLCCNYFPFFQDFSILTRESNDFKLKIMESLLIARDKPILNKAKFLFTFRAILM